MNLLAADSYYFDAGLIAKVAPNTLLTSSPDIWAHVNNKPGYKRTDWFFQAMRIEHLRDSVFTQTDNNAHERRRRQLAPGVWFLHPVARLS